jgi:cysteinyl-tRNA synthetase
MTVDYNKRENWPAFFCIREYQRERQKHDQTGYNDRSYLLEKEYILSTELEKLLTYRHIPTKDFIDFLKILLTYNTIEETKETLSKVKKEQVDNTPHKLAEALGLKFEDWADETYNHEIREQERALSSLLNERCAYHMGQIIKALNDDLNTPVAIQYLNKLADNVFILTGREKIIAAYALRSCLRFMGFAEMTHDEYFGITPEDKQIIQQQIEDRNTYRSAKNFAEADRIRKELLDMKIELMDGPEETTWKKLS